MTGRIGKVAPTLSSSVGEVKPLATSANGDYECLEPYSVIGNRPYYFAIGNCRAGWDIEVVAYAGENSQTHEHSYGGYIGSAYSYCGWIDTRYPLEKRNSNHNTACTNGSSNAVELEESSFMEKYDSTNSSHDGNYVVNPSPCPEYANYRPWSTNNVEKELIRTVPAYAAQGNGSVPALKWRYTTKYDSTDGTGQYVMVRDTRANGYEGNWVFVPRSCLRSPLPANEGESNPPPPSVTTDAASEVATPEAMLHAMVNPNGVATKYTFEYGTTTSYGLETPASEAGAGFSSVPVKATVAGLAPGTTYYFRVVASSATGESFGGAVSFSTQPAPTATTGEATEIHATTARLAGFVDPNGLATSFDFEYGLASSGYELTVPIPSGKLGAGESREVSEGVRGLSPATKYHYRVLASSSAGTNTGAERTFSTVPLGRPDAAVVNGAVEVYARSPENHLVEFAYEPAGNKWNSYDITASTGTQAAGDPFVVLTSGTIEVYARSPENHLVEFAYEPAGNKWNSYDITASTGTQAAGDPFVVLTSGTIEVYARSPENHLVEFAYEPAGNKWNSYDITASTGTQAAGDPFVVLTSGTIEVYARSPENHLVEFAYEPAGNKWNSYDITASTGTQAAGDPFVVLTSGTIEVYARSPENHLVEFAYEPAGNKWNSYDITASTGTQAAGDPFVVLTSGTIEVYAGDPHSHLVETIYEPTSNKWSSYDITATTGSGLG